VLNFILLLTAPDTYFPFPVLKTVLLNERYSLIYSMRRAVNLYAVLRSTVRESGDF